MSDNDFEQGRSSEDEEFYQTLKQAKEELKLNKDFHGERWHWVHDLDEEGFFIFGYLVEDFNTGMIDFKDFENTVYTLLLLKKKFLPTEVCAQRGLAARWVFQILFNLYEELKTQKYGWDECQRFVDAQFDQMQQTKTN